MYVGKWWNDKSIDLVEINGRVYALYGWNGEEWAQCWECLGDDYMEASEERYTIRPIYEEVDEDEWEIVAYQVI
jgi:hypothetical protein